MRVRTEGFLLKNHEDHVAGEGVNSLSHYNLVRKFIHMPQATMHKQQWRRNGKIGENSGMAARNEGAKVHFASLMDTCHLKNAELEAKHQKYKGRVVFRGDIVKDDTGSYAVFTEQGSSASQMTAAKVIDIISRLPSCAGRATGSNSVITSETKISHYNQVHKFTLMPQAMKIPDAKGNNGERMEKT